MSFMVNSYLFAPPAGPSSDVTIAVQDFATPTSAGVQNYTTATFGGATPQAALVVGTTNTAGASAEDARASFSLGAMVGVGEAVASMFSADNVASTSVGRGFESNRILRFNSGVVLNATSNDFVADGISLNYGAASATSVRCAFVGFAGNDLTVARNILSMGTGTGSTSVSLGFQPDVIFFFGDNGGDSLTSGAFMGFMIGVVTSAAARSVSWAEAHAAAAGAPFQSLNASGIHQVDAANGGLSYSVAITIDSDGFDWQPSVSTGSDYVGYLALNFGGRGVKLMDFTTPTSTGSSAITGVGFQPSFAFLVLTNREAIPSSFPVAGDDLGSALSVCLIGDEQWSFVNRIDSGADPTDTASFAKSTAVLGGSATSCSAIEATLTSFDSDGMTLNYTAVQGTAKKGFILFIE